GIGGIDGEKEAGAGVGQARGRDTKQAEGYDVAGLYIELVRIDLAARRGGEVSGEGASAGQGGIGGARPVDTRQNDVEECGGSQIGTGELQGVGALRAQIEFHSGVGFALIYATCKVDRRGAGSGLSRGL